MDERETRLRLARDVLAVLYGGDRDDDRRETGHSSGCFSFSWDRNGHSVFVVVRLDEVNSNSGYVPRVQYLPK